MRAYRSRTEVPHLVAVALETAAKTGFELSCTPETGRLLQSLTAGVRSGTIAEIGSGCGVGSAWIASTLRPEARFVTVELDRERAAGVQALLGPSRNVQVLAADWHEIRRYAPFALLFADTRSKQEEPETLLQSLDIGGMIVLDDLTPEDQWPPEWRGEPDPVREFWLNDPRLAATEIMVSPDMAVILATRVQ